MIKVRDGRCRKIDGMLDKVCVPQVNYFGKKYQKHKKLLCQFLMTPVS